MLLRRVFSNPILQHHPSVKIYIRRFFRHGKSQREIILIRLIHSIYRIAGPLVIGGNLPGNHIRFPRIRLKGIGIVFHVLQIILYAGNRRL